MTTSHYHVDIHRTGMTLCDCTIKHEHVSLCVGIYADVQYFIFNIPIGILVYVLSGFPCIESTHVHYATSVHVTYSICQICFSLSTFKQSATQICRSSIHYRFNGPSHTPLVRPGHLGQIKIQLHITVVGHQC